MKKLRIVLIVITVILLGGFIYASTFKIKEIRVTGCENVDEQVVIDAIKSQKVANNTLVLYLKNKFKPIKDIPFVSKVDIEFVDKNTISVTVYEKSIAGCIEYMNSYVYFDKDGIVLESSSDRIPSIPCIKGLNFNQWEIGSKLPIDDEKKFQLILNISQLIEKYDLSIDGIKFTAENEIVLYHEGITIELGEGEYLPIQMMNLKSILESLEGKEGTLYMKDYDSENSTASFSIK